MTPSVLLVVCAVGFGSLAAYGFLAAGAGYGRGEPRKDYLPAAGIGVAHLILAGFNLAVAAWR